MSGTKTYRHNEFMAELAKGHPQNWTEDRLAKHRKADPEDLSAYRAAMLATGPEAAGTETAATEQPTQFDLDAAMSAAPDSPIVRAAERAAERFAQRAGQR